MVGENAGGQMGEKQAPCLHTPSPRHTLARLLDKHRYAQGTVPIFSQHIASRLKVEETY